MLHVNKAIFEEEATPPRKINGVSVQQFFDHFAIANKSIQERMGAAPNALNKLSALYGMQARGLLQMLSYGNDMIASRAAAHLLNMDILRSNDAYLLKLGEGFLLNSIESITPPLIHPGNPFVFSSARRYEKYNVIGSITLRDGSSANLIIYEFKKLNETSPSGEQKYEVLYCAGQYVTQNFKAEDVDLTPGTFQSIYVPETYKAIWTPSVRIKLGGLEIEVTPAFSMAELLSAANTDNLVLCQHTGRGLTITLGDGEIFGAGYNNKDSFAKISSVDVSYIKTDSLSEAAPETISFNGDITPLNSNGTPVLDKPSTGDTPETFRSRAVAEMFASGKITDEKDLVTEIMKIPLIRSCAARREQNRHFPIAEYQPGVVYPFGAMVEYSGALYAALPSDKGSITDTSPDATDGAWQVVVPANIYSGLVGMGFNSETAFRYDNATIVMSGLMAAGRRYWIENHHYAAGDIVYHAATAKLYVAVADSYGEVPGTDSSDGTVYWAAQDDLGKDSPYSAYSIDDWVPITQAAYELELKGYFGLASKLGFTSVVVEPCIPVEATIVCKYSGAYRDNAEITRYIQDYASYNVGKYLSGAELHSQLTEKFGITRVYITVGRGTISDMDTSAAAQEGIQLATNEYVSTSTLSVELKEAD